MEMCAISRSTTLSLTTFLEHEQKLYLPVTSISWNSINFLVRLTNICTVAENCNERPNDGFPFLGNEGEKLERGGGC